MDDLLLLIEIRRVPPLRSRTVADIFISIFILISIRDKVLIMTNRSFLLRSFQVIPDFSRSLKWNIILGETIKVKSAMKKMI